MPSVPDKSGPRLVVRTREGVYATVPLTHRPVTIGRSQSCDLVLRDDGGVSREHAQVWLDERGRVQVADRGSKNGTRVDNSDAFRDAVRPAQRWIRVGEYEIEVVGVGRPPAALESDVRFTPDSPTLIGDTKFFPSSQRLDLNLHRLTLLMSLTERIGGAFERKQLLEQALDACCEALGFERGLIALKTPRGEPELPVTRNIQRDETGAFKISRTLINQALVHGERAIVNNPAVDLVANLSESLVRFPICSALCVPILHRSEVLGVIYGDRITKTADVSTYTPEDVDFLAAIAQQVGVGLANLRMFQEHLRTQKVYLELEQARTIQQRLLPARPLSLAHLTVLGHNEPSSHVGGDYFDYFPLGQDRVGLIVADVTGHGLPAALIMANLQAAVRVALTADAPLPDVADRLNRLVYLNTDSDVFITAIIGRICARTGRLEFVNAGHPAPLRLAEGRVIAVESDNSLPLGVRENERFRVQEVAPARSPSALLLYTDGLIEADDAAGRMLDLPPVIAALARLATPSAEAVLNAALETVRGHVGEARVVDDLTLMAAAFQPAS